MSNWPSDGVAVGSYEKKNDHLYKDIPEELKTYEGPRRRQSYIGGIRYAEKDLSILKYLEKNGESAPKTINEAIGNGTKEWAKNSLKKLLGVGKVNRTDKGVYSLV